MMMDMLLKSLQQDLCADMTTKSNTQSQKVTVLTKKQLKKWKVKYHFLIFGKPSFDLIIDDKSFDFKKDWHSRFIKKYLR
jgi:hypothetical protein